jgi:HEAT repeat protein
MGFFTRRPAEPADRAQAALAVIRAANTQEETNGNGLDNPKYHRAEKELASLGPDVVPLLIDALQALRPDSFKAEANIDRGVANDIAKALGAIGDPRGVGPLMEAGQRTIAEAPHALSMFPEGLDALLAGLDNPDEIVRANCITGLAYGANPPTNLPQVVKRMLSDASGWVRFTAAQVVVGRKIAEPELVPLLSAMMREDPDEQAQHMAETALQISRTAGPG